MLVRCVEPTDPQYHDAINGIAHVIAAGHSLVTFPQCLMEFWVVATRPIAVNGLGLTTDEAISELLYLERGFPVLGDPPLIFDIWKALVKSYAVHGKKAHDSRIVAAM